MPRIPQSNLDRGISSDVRTTAAVQDDSLAKALGNLGKTGEALFTKLKDQQDTSDFLDWRNKYDNNFRESRAQFLQDLSSSNLDGDFSYSGKDLNGKDTERAGNIYTERTNLENSQSKLSADGEGLVMGEKAKRHFTSKENQMGSKLSLDITTHMNKKRRVSVETQLNSGMNNFILDIKSGIHGTPADLESVLEKVNPNSAEANVLGSEVVGQKRTRFLASLGGAILEDIDARGDDSPALQNIIKKLTSTMDPRAVKRFNIARDGAKQRYATKVDASTTAAAKKMKFADAAEYEDKKNGIVPMMQRYNSVGSATEDKVKTTISILANSAQMDARANTDPTATEVDALLEAEKKFAAIKDSKVVQEYGEEAYKERFMAEVKSVTDSANKLKAESPMQFFTKYNSGVVELAKRGDKRVFSNMRALYEQSDTGRNKRSYAIKESIDNEKDFFKNRVNTGNDILVHLGDFQNISEDSNQVVMDHISEGGIPKYGLVIHELGQRDEMSVELAEAAFQFKANSEVGRWGIADDDLLGVTPNKVDKFIDAEMSSNFPVVRNTATGNTVGFDSKKDAIEKIVYKRLTEINSTDNFSRFQATAIVKQVVSEFAEKFRPINGDRGAATFEAESIRKANLTYPGRITEKKLENLMNSPESLLRVTDQEIDYESILGAIATKGVGEQNDSSRGMQRVLAEKNPENRKKLFMDLFGDNLRLDRLPKYNNRLSLTIGTVGARQPVLFRGDTPKVTKEGRPVIKNKDGTISTERTATVNIGGKFYNVPTLFKGESVSQEQAASIISKNKFVDPDTGRQLQEFSNSEDAVKSAEARSQNLGKELTPLGSVTMDDDELFEKMNVLSRKNVTDEIRAIRIKLSGRPATSSESTRNKMLRLRMKELERAL